MQRARTTSCSFSISIQRQTAFQWPMPQSSPRSVCVRIRLKRTSPGPIITSGVCATTIAPRRNWQSRGQVCRTTRSSSFSPATLFAAVTILPTPNAIFPLLSPSIHEIRTLTICWPILTCCNAGFLKRSASMRTCFPPASRRQSSNSGELHPSCPATPILDRCVIF